MQGRLVECFEQLERAFESMFSLARTTHYNEELAAVLEAILLQNEPRGIVLEEEARVALAWKKARNAYTALTTLRETVLASLRRQDCT